MVITDGETVAVTRLIEALAAGGTREAPPAAPKTHSLEAAGRCDRRSACESPRRRFARLRDEAADAAVLLTYRPGQERTGCPLDCPSSSGRGARRRAPTPGTTAGAELPLEEGMGRLVRRPQSTLSLPNTILLNRNGNSRARDIKKAVAGAVGG
jgi:hypothetical protein